MYGLAFRSAAGQAARDYADRRGLTAATLKRFEIGYAPDARHHQTEIFKERGLLDEAIAAGLLIRPDDGGVPYDRFRGRLMFPIRDPRGRCIAFGGRALDPNAQAKYLNSPETELFHKGRTLYNHGLAREAAGKAGGVIVAEGYMDVIALTAAGFENAVAPLGTAITEEQLALIWRMADEPVIALDGDQAGIRAANRLIELALPKLVPGKSLSFCILPDGRDPDDLIRAEGSTAMRGELKRAIPLIDMLWRREKRQRESNTPERLAELEVRINNTVRQIRDSKIKSLYSKDLTARLKNLQWESQKSKFGTKKKGTTAGATPSTPLTDPARLAKNTASGVDPQNFQLPKTMSEELESLQNENLRIENLIEFQQDRDDKNRPQYLKRAHAENSAKYLNSTITKAEARIREGGILLIACHNPGALGPVERALEEMTLRTPEFGAVRDAILAAVAESANLSGSDMAAVVRARTGLDPFELFGRLPQARAHPMARPDQPSERVVEVLTEAIARHQAALAFEAEMAEAARDLPAAEGEDWTWRIKQAGLQVHEAERLGSPDYAAEGGETVSEIQRMLDNQVYKSKKR
jgi:DNA primase